MLDDEVLLSITRLRDPIGVLSIYVEADPEQQASRRPVWEVATKSALRALKERVRSEGPRERWAAFSTCLEELEPELDRLLDAREPGRGRALFTAVCGDAIHRVTYQVPLVDLVALEKRACVRPLASAIEAGRPVGLVTVSRSGVRALEWRLGQIEELAQLRLDEETEEWRELRGPAAANPAFSYHTAPQTDLFERRLEKHRARFLHSVAGEMEALATSRGWERLLVAGDPRLREALTHALRRSNDREVLLSEHSFEGLSPAELATAVLPQLDEARRRRELDRVEHARNEALEGGRGALGLGDTLAALAAGRVSLLLLDRDRDFRGAVAPDGSLLPEGEMAPGISEWELAPEPQLAERMIEQALETRAQVSLVEGPAAEALATGGGVAALLRW